MSLGHLTRGVCGVTFAVLFSSSVLLAQSSRGTVTGLVTDSSKASVPGATVELTSQETKVTRSTTTNSAGIYRFDAVIPAVYSLTVTANGFQVASIQSIDVEGTRITSIDAELSIGQVTNVVEVSAETQALQTEAPVRGGVIDKTSMINLPIASQNPVMLSLTLPGVSTNRYSFGASTFSVNGARGRSNNFMIDGTENNDISVSGQAFTFTNPDSVAETAVQTSNFDAEYGRAGGAVVNVITKSGTGEFHGTARYLLDSTIDDAPTNLMKTSQAVLDRGHPLSWHGPNILGHSGRPDQEEQDLLLRVLSGG